MENKNQEVRKEILREWFYPGPVFVDQKYVGPPEGALEKYEDLKENWQKKHPKGIEKPGVMMFPVHDGEKEGFMVQTYIMHPPKQVIMRKGED